MCVQFGGGGTYLCTVAFTASGASHLAEPNPCAVKEPPTARCAQPGARHPPHRFCELGCPIRAVLPYVSPRAWLVTPHAPSGPTRTEARVRVSFLFRPATVPFCREHTWFCPLISPWARELLPRLGYWLGVALNFMLHSLTKTARLAHTRHPVGVLQRWGILRPGLLSLREGRARAVRSRLWSAPSAGTRPGLAARFFRACGSVDGGPGLAQRAARDSRAGR